MSIVLPAKGEFRTLIANRLRELDMSIKEIANRVGLSCEYMRKIVNHNEALPSKYVLKEIAIALDLDQAELRKSWVAERLRNQNFDLSLLEPPQDFMEFAEGWKDLTPVQKTEMRTLLGQLLGSAVERKSKTTQHNPQR